MAGRVTAHPSNANSCSPRMCFGGPWGDGTSPQHPAWASAQGIWAARGCCPTGAREGVGWLGLDGVFWGASTGSLCPSSSSCWDHSGDKSNFPTSSSRDK